MFLKKRFRISGKGNIFVLGLRIKNDPLKTMKNFFKSFTMKDVGQFLNIVYYVSVFFWVLFKIISMNFLGIGITNDDIFMGIVFSMILMLDLNKEK